MNFEWPRPVASSPKGHLWASPTCKIGSKTLPSRSRTRKRLECRGLCLPLASICAMLAGLRSRCVGSSIDCAEAMAAASGTSRNEEATRLPTVDFSAYTSVLMGATVETAGVAPILVNGR